MVKKKRSKSKKNALAALGDNGGVAAMVVDKPVKAPEIDWSAFKLEILADTSGDMKKEKKV